jgi:catechol 2,3-dioxygenase-like lactoylglutathione lyase family enzyme
VSIVAFDHVAIPIEHVDAMLSFYRALGFEVRDRGGPFYSVHFGDEKINFHGPAVWRSPSFTLRGPTAQPGCGDFCFVWAGTLASLQAALQGAGVPCEEGPVARVGGRRGGKVEGISVYVRDPDRKLLEFIVYESAV